MLHSGYIHLSVSISIPRLIISPQLSQYHWLVREAGEAHYLWWDVTVLGIIPDR